MQPLAAVAHGIDASNGVQHDLCDLDEPLEVLSMSTNPDGLNTWDDIRKMIHDEKVVNYHHYAAKMINEGKISHMWGIYSLVDRELSRYVAGVGMVVFRVKDLDEFEDVFRQDPVLTSSEVFTVPLKPLASQRMDDERALELARGRVK